MKRFKLSRKGKLLFATPLLALFISLLVLAWPQVMADSMDRRLRELAGPEAVDCGVNFSGANMLTDSCAIAAAKSGKPFMIGGSLEGNRGGVVRTPQGQVYEFRYYRPSWQEKASIRQSPCSNAEIVIDDSGQQSIDYHLVDGEIIETQVWW